VDLGGVVRVGVKLVASKWVCRCLARLGSSRGLAENRSRSIGNGCRLGQGLAEACSKSHSEEDVRQHRCKMRSVAEEVVKAMVLDKMEVLRPYLKLRIRPSPNTLKEPHQSQYHPGR
jgi:hypothetical protein